jgi:hypothetical protein
MNNNEELIKIHEMDKKISIFIVSLPRITTQWELNSSVNLLFAASKA